MTFSSLEALLLTLFGLAWLLIIYHHLVYPLILKFVYTQSISPSQADALQEDEISSLPHICILVPAYNEGDVIADKIRNVASLDYPKNKLSLLIACDGCSDDTADIVRKTLLEPEVHELKVELIEYLENRGKVAVLNQTIPQLECDIVGLSDASALISFDSLIICARQFYDDKLGILAATYKLLKPGSNGEKSYWQYQTKVKEIESSLGSPIGVHGALYFFRQHL
jgi:cellulose synthase/poly-beta-1,6-N-acetylglucosamine synthase-like glycosyltransferase